MRKFLKVSLEQFKKDINDKKAKKIYDEINMPIRATNLSAGYDFYSPKKYILKMKESLKIPTGIRVEMQNDEWLAIYIRSSLGFKYNIRLKNSVGVIDADYINADNEGHIWVALCNHGDKDIVIEKGEPFAQGIFHHYLLVENDLPKEIHRNGGIGSTHNKN
jgi:dUTP pyrophosphatase